VKDHGSKESSGLEFTDWQLEMYGRNTPELIQLEENSKILRITRSQQTLNEFPTILRMKIRSKPAKSSGDILIKRLTY
jgi:alpha-L-fucosidase